MTLELRTIGEAETIAAGAALGRLLEGGDVVALTGELGAGKTCFVRGLAAGLGLDPGSVSSPTFVICQHYEGGRASLTLAHLDAYRLESADELETIGWDELPGDPRVVIAVEWADRITAALPPDRFDVDIAHADEHARLVRMTGHGRTRRRLDRLQPDAAGTGAGARRCPSCDGPVDRAAPTAPFCSTRCRLADLGQWFRGAYTIGRPLGEDDLLDT